MHVPAWHAHLELAAGLALHISALKRLCQGALEGRVAHFGNGAGRHLEALAAAMGRVLRAARHDEGSSGCAGGWSVWRTCVVWGGGQAGKRGWTRGPARACGMGGRAAAGCRGRRQVRQPTNASEVLIYPARPAKWAGNGGDDQLGSPWQMKLEGGTALTGGQSTLSRVRARLRWDAGDADGSCPGCRYPSPPSLGLLPWRIKLGPVMAPPLIPSFFHTGDRLCASPSVGLGLHHADLCSGEPPDTCISSPV